MYKFSFGIMSMYII